MSNRLDQERQNYLEPKRVHSTAKKLMDLGFNVEIFGGNRIEFLFEGKLVTFFPYSGWFTGKTVTDGRGFNNLLKQIQ